MRHCIIWGHFKLTILAWSISHQHGQKDYSAAGNWKFLRISPSLPPYLLYNCKTVSGVVKNSKPHSSASEQNCIISVMICVPDYVILMAGLYFHKGQMFAQILLSTQLLHLPQEVIGVILLDVEHNYFSDPFCILNCAIKENILGGRRGPRGTAVFGLRQSRSHIFKIFIKISTAV